MDIIKDLINKINDFDGIDSVSDVEYEIKDNGDIICIIPCDIKPVKILIESKNYNGTVLNNICNYPVIDIEKIIEGMEKSQVEVMVKNLSDRMYNGENFDLNKINAVSRASGIDILQRVNNMKSFAESKK